MNAPDDGGGSGGGEDPRAGDGKAKRARPRGARGGRGRVKPKAAVAASPAATPAKGRGRAPAARTRRKSPAKQVTGAGETTVQQPEAAIAPPVNEMAAPREAGPQEKRPQESRPVEAGRVEAAPRPAVSDDPRAENYYTQEEIAESSGPGNEAPPPEREHAPDPAPPQNTPAGGGGGFVPAPPRVGMRPAVVRGAPGRMSFSKGSTRHQFRPSGFKGPGSGSMPRPITAVPGEDERAHYENAPGGPRQELPPGGNITPPPSGQPGVPGAPAVGPGGRAQHPHHRGPQGRVGQQPGQQPGQQGGRHDQRHNQLGRPPMQKQNHPRGNQGRQQGPMHGGRQGQRGQGPIQGGPPRPQPGHVGPPRGALPPVQPRSALPPIQGRALPFTPPAAPPVVSPVPPGYPQAESAFSPPPAETTSDMVQLPAQPTSASDDVLTPESSALQAAAPMDVSALAPFAEDIELDETLSAPPAPRRAPTGRDMLINVVEGEEVRIAVIRRGQLEELYMERSSTESHIGNIYKGRVTNVEPSIQAAFIDFGIGKNGFLHISDLHPQYFPRRNQPRMPQQRRHTPPPNAGQRGGPGTGHRGPVTPVVAENGAGAPGAPATPPDSPLATENSAPSTPMAHAAGGEAPAVQFEQAATENDAAVMAESGPREGETGTENVQVRGEAGEAASSSEGVEPETHGEGGATVETIAEENAGEEASGTEENAPSATTDGGAGQAGAESGGTPAAGVEEPDEARADFGSAYNSDFGEDEEFVDDYESADLDDGHMKPMEKVGRKTPRRDRPPIQQCLKRGQEVIVQVTKEGIGTKGPTLTSYVSCPGRYLVMMPGMAQLGVSRKIEDLDQRRELKRTLQELNPPRNLGFIIRTAGTEVAKKELQGDLNYLVRMWKVIANRIRTHKAPVELYQESDLVIRTIRDVFNEEIDRIIVDNEQVASRVRDFLSIVDPRSAGIVEQYTGTMPLFQKFGVEREIEKINTRRVEMNNGGSLVIDSTEALVAIDVNSGRYREQRDAELTAFNMNKEALKEVVRQLRLRDLGGVIVIDFIDMRDIRHKREIERLLAQELSTDRAKTKVLPMSQFCMIEMTRQRVRPSIKRSIYMDCPHCHGSALIKTPESVSLDVMRRLAAGLTRLDVVRLDVRVYPTVSTFLLNRKRKALVELEEKTGKRINVAADDALAGDQIVLQAYDGRGSLLNIVL